MFYFSLSASHLGKSWILASSTKIILLLTDEAVKGGLKGTRASYLCTCFLAV